MSERFAEWISSFVDFLLPGVELSFPAWLYTITDLEWLLITQAFFFLLLYLRIGSASRNARKAVRLVEKCDENEHQLYLEVMRKTAELAEAIRESGAETEEQLRLEIGDKVIDLAMRVERLRQDTQSIRQTEKMTLEAVRASAVRQIEWSGDDN